MNFIKPILQFLFKPFNSIIVVGAGAHARVCIEILQLNGYYVKYCIGIESDGDSCLNIPILKGDHYLRSLRKNGYKKIFIALGSNAMRDHYRAIVLGLGYDLMNVISSNSTISLSANLGIGLAIMPGAVIGANSTIEDVVIVNSNAVIEHDCVVGRSAHIASNASLAGGVIVGERTLIGVGSSVIPNTRIGANVIIGAGSVLIKEIVDDTRVVGNPARYIDLV